MKRKTLKNNVEKLVSYSKSEIDEKIKALGISESVRADGLTLEQLFEVYKALFE